MDSFLETSLGETQEIREAIARGDARAVERAVRITSKAHWELSLPGRPFELRPTWN